ncbi:MAG: 2-oxoglutarate and iron-dependent oxygenase domain-containing protein, partial [Burkholderiales bacterium]
MSYATAREIGASAIPVIDVAPLVDGSPAAVRPVARAMLEAAESIGFFYVINHGIEQGVLDGVDRNARAFFARPEEEKLTVKPLDRHRGFLSVGQAKMSPGAKIDLKESYIWGIDIDEHDPDVLAGNRMFGPNRWPASMPAMQPALNAFFEQSNVC